MEITYKSHNFPASHFGPDFRGTKRLSFTIQELMWSALTVGRASITDVLKHGIYSEYEILYRAAILVANLELKGTTLVKSSAYQNLDPSEKSAVSYFLGLTFTKLLSAKLLDMHCLLHIDVYRDQLAAAGYALKFGSSRSRPDLIGRDKYGRFIVIESKGRTNTMESTLLDSAKFQTKNLRLIGVESPWLRVAVVTHFKKGQLIVDWSDPEGYNDEYFDIKTDDEEYLSNYYKLIFNILETNNESTIKYGRYVTYKFDAINLTIGLDEEIIDGFKNGTLKEVQPARILDFDEFSSINNQKFFRGDDGIVVGLGDNWEELIKTNKK